MLDLNTLPLARLFEALTADGCLARLVRAAFDEDLGSAGDITSQSIIAESRTAKAALVAREPGVIAGLEAMAALTSHFPGEVIATLRHRDGNSCESGAVLGELSGSLRAILALERTMLNLLSRLSGIAALTRRHVEAARGTKAVICDTRKTTPGLRNLEKYAVRCGGGTLHRLGLFDAALFKDNHLAGIPEAGLTKALNAAARAVRASHEVRFVEVEVDSLRQLTQVLACEAGLIDMILLDNMPAAELNEAAAMRDRLAPRVLLEASGGIDLSMIAAAAASGVDRISIGAITHSAAALDLALDVL